MTRAPNFRDLTGQRFGRLIALSFGGCRSDHSFWLCRCDCGNEKQVGAYNLSQGKVKSCGCYRKENIARGLHRSHGLSGSPERQSLMQAITRCYNPNHMYFAKYGGRGLKVCDRWRLGDGTKTGIECFLADMGRRPSLKYSLDRIDNDGDYEPGNCRWATRSQQNRNRPSVSRIVVVNGKSISLAEACETAAMNYYLVHSRLRAGWSIERALEPGDARRTKHRMDGREARNG